jgi:hypothetical protein
MRKSRRDSLAIERLARALAALDDAARDRRPPPRRPRVTVRVSAAR